MTLFKVAGVALAVLLVAGGTAYSIFSQDSDGLPDFVSLDGPNSTLKWKSGHTYVNMLAGKEIQTIQLSKIDKDPEGGSKFNFEIVSADPNYNRFNFDLSPVDRSLAAAQAGNFAYCKLCVPSARTPFARTYSVIWPKKRSLLDRFMGRASS